MEEADGQLFLIMAAKDNAAIDPDYKGKVPQLPDKAFEGGLQPHPGGDPTVVRSTPYRPFTHEHLWKFSWVIQIDGDEVDRWDPHFSGDRKN